MPHDGNMQRVLICAPYSSAVRLCKGSQQSKTNSSVITKYRAVGLLGKTCRNRVAHLHLQQTDKLTALLQIFLIFYAFNCYNQGSPGMNILMTKCLFSISHY